MALKKRHEEIEDLTGQINKLKFDCENRKEDIEKNKKNIIERYREMSVDSTLNIYDIGEEYSTEGEDLEREISQDVLQAAFDKGGFIGFLEVVGRKQKSIKVIFEHSKKAEILLKGEDFTDDSNFRQKPTGIRSGGPQTTPISRNNDLNTYTDEFIKAEGYSGDNPSNNDIKSASSRNFNLGQIVGPGFGPSTNPWLLRDNIHVLLSGIRNGRFTFSSFLSAIDQGRFSGDSLRNTAFNPAFLSPTNPKYEKISLEVLLQQNLLLPDASSTPDKMYESSYLTNRGVLPDFLLNRLGSEDRSRARRYDAGEGIMGGDFVNARQEPDADGTKVFDFAEEIGSYKPDRGFNGNFGTDKPETLQSAVVNIDDASEAEGIDESYREKQYFPFLFVTENRSTERQVCFFQATIASLNESFSPNWSTKSFVGRTEKVYTYTETDRSIDIQFSIYATSLRDLANVYERLNWLAQQTYGEYIAEQDAGGNIERLRNGPLIRISIGDLFKGVPGFIQSLSFDYNAGGMGGRWELTDGLRMPQIVNVQMNLMVLHDSMPNRNGDFYAGLNNAIVNKGKRGLLTNVNGDNKTYVEQLSRNPL